MTAQGQEIMNRLAILPETNYGDFRFKKDIAREIECVIGKEKVERTLQRMTDDFKLDDAELQTALKLLSGLVKDQLITVKEAAKRAGLTEEEFVEKTGVEVKYLSE